MNPIEPVRNLARMVGEATRDMGLELVGYSLVPSMDGVGPDVMQLVFRMHPESLLTPEDREAQRTKNDLDAAFGALTDGLDKELASDAETEKIEAAKAGVQDLLKDFLDE